MVTPERKMHWDDREEKRMLMNANVESFGLTKLYFNDEVVCCIFQLRHKGYQMEIQVFQIQIRLQGFFFDSDYLIIN